MEPLRAGDPRQLGRFRLRGRLGSGGMGEVFVATSNDGRWAAVKRIHPYLGSESSFRERFRREVEASRRVGGSYTAAVMDADTDDERPWLASVLVPGPPLDLAVHRCGPLPLPALRVLASGLAAALGEVHRAGLVHRDVKPSNVVLAADGPRLLDFGIARPVEDDTQLQRTMTAIGTPPYMSPEHLDPARLGPASDVFSLGSVLAFAASGHPPFGTGPVPQLALRLAGGDADLRGVPPELLGVVRPCLAVDPARRPTPAQVMDLVGELSPQQSWLPAPFRALVAEQQAALDALLAPVGAPAHGDDRPTVQRPAAWPPPDRPVAPPVVHPAARAAAPPSAPLAGPGAALPSAPPAGAALPAEPRPARPTPPVPPPRRSAVYDTADGLVPGLRARAEREDAPEDRVGPRRRGRRAPLALLAVLTVALLALGAVAVFDPFGDDAGGAGAAPPVSGAPATGAPSTSALPPAEELAAIAREDDVVLRRDLIDRWVPQLASAQAGDELRPNDEAVLLEHRDLRNRYDNVRLLRSGDWPGFRRSGFWVTVAGVPFDSAEEANGWCESSGRSRDDCFARLVSTTAPPEEASVQRR